MVLLGNDFSGIVAAVFEGRRIFSNLRRSFSYLVSFHIPVIVLALVPPFFNWPPILLPIHIILLELLVHPISAFTFENIIPNTTEKNCQKNILNQQQVRRSVLRGLLLSLSCILIYWLHVEKSPDQGRAFSFATILIGNSVIVLFEVFPSLTLRFYLTAAVILILTVIITMTHFFNLYFHFKPITVQDFCIAIAVSAISIIPTHLKKNRAFVR
jgi:Ca2+-transporting ATPase